MARPRWLSALLHKLISDSVAEDRGSRSWNRKIWASKETWSCSKSDTLVPLILSHKKSCSFLPCLGTPHIGMFPLRTQTPHCEKPKSHGEATCRYSISHSQASSQLTGSCNCQPWEGAILDRPPFRGFMWLRTQLPPEATTWESQEGISQLSPINHGTKKWYCFTFLKKKKKKL